MDQVLAKFPVSFSGTSSSNTSGYVTGNGSSSDDKFVAVKGPKRSSSRAIEMMGMMGKQLDHLSNAMNESASMTATNESAAKANEAISKANDEARLAQLLTNVQMLEDKMKLATSDDMRDKWKQILDKKLSTLFELEG